MCGEHRRRGKSALTGAAIAFLPLCLFWENALHAQEARRIVGLPDGPLRVERIPAETFWRTALTPVVDFIEFAALLGEHGLPYLLFWICLIYAVAAALDPSGRLRRPFLARLVVLFLLSTQLLFGALYLSSFFGQSYRLAPPPAHVVFDPHCHSTYSTGLLSPAQLVEWHHRRGYNAMAVTDGNSTRGSREASVYARQRYPSFHVVIGEEYKRSKHGVHLVLLGIETDILPQEFDVGEAIAEAHRQGGIAIVAHPWSVRGMSLEEIANLGVDGFEVFNGVMQGNEELYRLCTERGLIMLGATDYKKGPHAHVWNVLPLDLAYVPPGERTREILRTLKTRANSIVAAPDFPIIDGFASPDWQPESSVWTPVNTAIAMVRRMPTERRLAWCGWIAVLGLGVYWRRQLRRQHNRRVRYFARQPAMARRQSSFWGWVVIVLCGLGILACGACVTAYKIKEVFFLTPEQCVAMWIVLDVFLLIGFSQVKRTQKTSAPSFRWKG